MLVFGYFISYSQACDCAIDSTDFETIGDSRQILSIGDTFAFVEEIDGWTSNGRKIEVKHNNNNLGNANSGKHYVALNRQNSKIEKNVITNKGEQYVLKLFFSPRYYTTSKIE